MRKTHSFIHHSLCNIFIFPLCLQETEESKEGTSVWPKSSQVKQKKSLIVLMYYFVFSATVANTMTVMKYDDCYEIQWLLENDGWKEHLYLLESLPTSSCKTVFSVKREKCLCERHMTCAITLFIFCLHVFMRRNISWCSNYLHVVVGCWQMWW